MRSDEGSRSRSALILCVAMPVAGVVAVVVATSGINGWTLPLVALIAVSVASVRRWGLATGVGIGVVGVLAAVLAVVTGLGLAEGVATVSGGVGAAFVGVIALAVVAIARERTGTVVAQQMLNRWSAIRPIVIPSVLVALAFPPVMLLAGVVPGSTRLAWVMRGDSANNLLFAREILHRGSIAIGPGENPVPLPSALIALVADPGRAGVQPGALLEHDLAAFAVLWSGLIALTCALSAIVAGFLVTTLGGRVPAVVVASIAAGLLPMSWVFTGTAMESGFFNTHVAVVLLLATLLIGLGTGVSPLRALASLVVAGVLTLAVWSPFVLVPMALAAVVLGTSWRQLRASTISDRVVLAVVALVAVADTTFVVVPGVLTLGMYLGGRGRTHKNTREVLILLAIGCVVLVMLAVGTLRSRLVGIVIALVASFLLGQVALLAVSGFAWTYYPLKFSWLASLVLMVVATGLAVAVVARLLARVRAPWFVGAITAVAIGIVAAVWLIPSVVIPTTLIDPAQSILTGSSLGEGDTVANEILRLATPVHANLLWNSGDEFEVEINFLILQMWAGEITSEPPLRVVAYGTVDKELPSELCRVATLMGGDVAVVTADESLTDAIAVECPSLQISIEVADRSL